MEAPQLCPWCGSQIVYEPHDHEPRYAELAERHGADPGALPARVREVLAGESFIGVCPRCRTISHVVGHRPPG